MTAVIDAKGIYYKQLNEQIRSSLDKGEKNILIKNVNGQRYIGDGVTGSQSLIVEGTPGNDMAAFMNGLEIEVKGNSQDGTGNTMNAGRVIIHGHTGDTTGYAMRGGEIFVRDYVGYRVGIHMKEYMDIIPAIVIGGTAGDFLGEYMAGGILMLLGLDMKEGEEIAGDYCGTGMHGGVMYIRGDISEYKLGKEVKIVELTDEDNEVVHKYVKQYVEYFGGSVEKILSKPFSKLIPFNKRPYGNLYTHW
ncbi:MAG: hypothetical protein WCR27_04470 [Eubacteriales bacterium]